MFYMLPDFPSIKLQLARQHVRKFRSEMKAQMPLASRIKAVRIHEGDHFAFERDDGVIEKKQFTEVKKPIVVSPSLEFKETISALKREEKTAASELAELFERTLLAEVEETSTQVGNAIDMKGALLTAEAYLDAFGRVDVDFDIFGMPRFPMLVVHPSMAGVLRKELRRIGIEPALKTRAYELLKKKYEDWRDRESRRRLVD